jgi:hypothetical protein
MNKELAVSQQYIEKIYIIRGVQVMLDSDLAEMYSVTTSRLNEQVKRNSERFPNDFMFQLRNAEWRNLQSQSATTSLTSQNAILKDNRGKHRKYLPYVFTEQGVAGLLGTIGCPGWASRAKKVCIIFIEGSFGCFFFFGIILWEVDTIR